MRLRAYCHLFLKNYSLKVYSDVRQCSSMVSEFKRVTTNDKRSLYRTSIDDPTKHDQRLESLFYTVPKEHFNRWMSKGLTPHYYATANSFGEACIMIRKPAIEIAGNLKMVNEKLPVPKFVLHGRNGCGKSTTLAHLIHYVGIQDWLVVHIPWAPIFNRNMHADNHLSSHSKVPRLDQPTVAVGWLSDFRTMNEPLLKKLDIRTTENYVWTKRDESKPNTSLCELIDFAQSRPKYATDVMGIILKELKSQCNAGKFKVLVAIDGINSLWGITIFKKEEDRTKKYSADEISIIHFMKKLIANDWNNGAIVCTVDGNAASIADEKRHLPQDLLGQSGFESLDPFLPVLVDNYTDKEFYTCLQYFFDHHWFAKPYSQTDEGMAEIKALSCKNPKEVYELGVWM